jgi:hypothetical protein
MASSGKRKTTMAKLNRERRLIERRVEKQARKDARKRAAADERAEHTDAVQADGGDGSLAAEGADPAHPAIPASGGVGTSTPL